MRQKTHKVDFCVVGGGLAGMCAAIAAARHGVKVALMHDRPVLGGNASSEVRMWVCGARGYNNRETGIIEEIELENLYRNNYPNYSVWDSILYEKVRFEDNIVLLLNCSCNNAEMHGNKIKSVKGWQLTTQTWHVVEADFFADCSGDSILAPLTGADFRSGREAKDEFDESIEPDKADNKTMGLSCLIQARETGEPQKYIPPKWAHKYPTDQDLPNRSHRPEGLQNYWWIELGGEQDTIHDTEEIRDELLKVAFGVWDHIKNYGDHGADNWILEWVGFLPGRRESRRYVGKYIVTQNDVLSEGRFEDIAAYGGWSMDDHHPAGIKYPGHPTIFHKAPSPYGIPYRSLYSKNIENLFFAGRNISVTHAAMSSTRVMATCALLGQAVGTAAAIAVMNNLTPDGVYKKKVNELKQTLMYDDCYLPFNKREISGLTKKVEISSPQGGPERLRNGIDRPIGEEENAWVCTLGTWVEYRFEEAVNIKELRLVFDSDLNREMKNMVSLYPLNIKHFQVPKTMVRKFCIQALNKNGEWQEVFKEENNYQRNVKIKLDIKTTAMRFCPEHSWGNETVKIFAWDISD